MARDLVLVRMSKTKAQGRAKKIVLVTGATSGMGSRLVGELIKKGYEVRVLLKKHPREHLEWKELPRGVKIYITDIKKTDDASREVLLDACKGASILFHLAAVTYSYHSRYSNEKIDTNVMLNTNVIGTENVIQAYADANPKGNLRFIYSSSVAVYGYKRSGEILTEESEPKPHSAYAESKYMAEQVIKAFAAANKRITYTILRIGVLYGHGYETNFMHIFKLIKEKKIRYIGNGENHLTLVNVDDTISAMLKVMETEKSANKVYNLTDGVPYTQRQLFKKAAQFLSAEEPSKTIHPFLAKIGARTRGIGSEQFTFLISNRIVSMEKIRKELGFKPAVSIDVAGKALAKEFLKKYRAK